jgi:hypothetical protein
MDTPKDRTLNQAKPIKKPLPPVNLYQTLFCQNCQDQEYCKANTDKKLHCILCLIADELARIRQLIQNRTQHLNW